MVHKRLPTAQAKQRKLKSKFPVRENTWDLETLLKDGELYTYPICELPDSKYVGQSILENSAAKITICLWILLQKRGC